MEIHNRPENGRGVWDALCVHPTHPDTDNTNDINKSVFGPPLPRHRSYGSACEIQRNVLPYRSRGLVRLTVLQTDQYLECCMRIRETKHDTEMLLKQKQC
jgi:hypothetical protein